MPADQDSRTSALILWVSQVTKSSHITLTRTLGGGRHEAWIASSSAGQQWFLRCDSSQPEVTEKYTLRREAEIYRAVHALGIPSPAVIAVHEELEAVLLEYVPGTAAFARLDSESQTSIIDDFAPWLAHLHAADPKLMDIPMLKPVGTVSELVIRELDEWELRLDATGSPDPVLTACFIWLRSNLPSTENVRPSLVQGDTGPGNFLHDGQKVTAFLDFELAHLGDPMEDIAWVGTRNAQEPVPDFARFLRAYNQASGSTPDPTRIRYHALFAELRIAVLGAERKVSELSDNTEPGNLIIYGALHRRLTIEALAVAMGVEFPEVQLPILADTTRTALYDATLSQMLNVVGPHISDPYGSRRLKGLARVIKYLKECDRAGDSHDDTELEEISQLIKQQPKSLDEANRILLELVRLGIVTPLEILPHAAHQAMRRNQVAATAMGVLATRHLPVI